MKARFPSVAGLVLAVCVAGLLADTIPAGDVSGVWHKANSPFYIAGDITIPASDTLIVEPGVSVIFLGNDSLVAVGLLEAVGTPDDTIRFFPADTATGWKGIDIQSVAAVPHRLSYCTISHTLTGLGATGIGGYLDVDISHCSFRRNTRAMYWEAVGITDLQVSDCAFRGNGPAVYGAAVVLLDIYGPVEITGCLFENNAATDCGGAMYINQCPSNAVRISDCTFLGNTAAGNGGAICAEHVEGVTVAVEYCTFGGNSADDINLDMGGGAIWGSDVDDFRVSYCSFYGNRAWYGASVNVSPQLGNAGFTLDHCTFRGSGSVEVSGDGYSAATLDVTNCIFTHCEYAIANFSKISLSVEYSDFHDNSTDLSSAPSGFGVLDRVNANGDSCDAFHNIFLYPLFADTANHDFHLTAGSPCIDAGDPAFAYDPDTTLTDIGAYWFDQRLPIAALSDSVLDFGTVNIGEHGDLTLTVYNRGTGDLVIRGVTNSQAVFATNYVSADSVVGPGDSLLITVTFTPADDSLVRDTLYVDNSGQDAAVALSGTGQYPVGVVKGREPGIRRLGLRQAGAMFAFDIPRRTWVSLKVCNNLGREVAAVALQEMDAGSHRCAWTSEGLPAGGYFFVLDAGDNRATGMFVVPR